MNFWSLAEKRDFLSKKENLKTIKNKVNLVTLEAAQFGDVDSTMSYLEEICQYIVVFNDVLKDYTITYPVSIIDPPIGEISEEDVQKTIKRIVEAYVHVFSGFLELASTMLSRFYVKMLELENGDPLSSNLLLLGMQFFLLKEELKMRIGEIEEIIDTTWEDSSSIMGWIYESVIKHYNSNRSGIQKQWGEICAIIKNSLKRELNQPAVFDALALALLNDEENDPDFLISLRGTLIKKKVEESKDLPSCVREFNRCYKRSVSNKEDTSSLTSLITGLYNIKNSIDDDGLGFAGLSVAEAEIFVFNALGMFKIIDEIFIGKMLTIEEFPASIIRCIAYSVQQCMEVHKELVDTYLLYQFIRKVVPFMEKRSCEDVQDAFIALFEVFYGSPYLASYLASSVTKESLEEIQEYLPEGCDEEVDKLFAKFSEYGERDKEGRFQDAITTTFINTPCLLPGGDSKIWVDRWMIECHLQDCPENPFNRETLTIYQLREYNEKRRKEVEEYERERKEFMG